MDEPTIYDFVVSIFKKDQNIPLKKVEISQDKNKESRKKGAAGTTKVFRFFGGSILALMAQYFLEPVRKSVVLSLVLYLASFLMIWTSIRQEETNHSKKTISVKTKIIFRVSFFIISILSQIVAFMLFSDNRFNFLNLFFWVIGIVGMVLAFWSFDKPMKSPKHGDGLVFGIVFIFVLLVVIYFRIHQIDSVPGEMYSDHAEKLLDIQDIYIGKFSTYFERNTGREPFQFYITALIIRLFNTGFTFKSLKIGTIGFGLLTLPFIYLIGKQLMNKWAALAAMFLAGVAYWPNVISRVGLRYALYPLFTAPVIYFLFRGIKKKRINDFILCGISVGLGLLGYSSYRIVPLFVLVVLILAFLKENKSQKSNYLLFLFVIGLISLSIFIPLLRYWFDHPQMFSYRSMTRLTQIEKPFEEPALLILIKNLISSIIMPFWNNGHIWVHSIPDRPALDFITGGFFAIGLALLIKSMLYKKDFEIMILMLSIPFLMLPSILSLAYPGENPSLNRSGAAYIPISIIAGYGLYSFAQISSKMVTSYFAKYFVPFIVITFTGLICFNNYMLVFKEYKTQFLQKAWNSSEIGQVVEEFQSRDEANQAFVVPYAHWVDTRLVGINAGFPGKDFALWREDLPISKTQNGDKIFIYKPEDIETKMALKAVYPTGDATTFQSKVLGKEFIIYTVLNN